MSIITIDVLGKNNTLYDVGLPITFENGCEDFTILGETTIEFDHEDIIVTQVETPEGDRLYLDTDREHLLYNCGRCCGFTQIGRNDPIPEPPTNCLIVHNCITAYTGYDPTATQYLENNNGTLQWVAASSGFTCAALALANCPLTAQMTTDVNVLIAAAPLPFAHFTGLPTTLGGYGITDAYTKTEGDARYFQIANNLSEGNHATQRTNLGLGTAALLNQTTVGGNIVTLPNPSAITFLRINADNSVSTLDAATFRTAIGAGTGSGTVTSVGFTGGIISVATATTTPALTVAGTSGGGVYFSSTTTWASTALLAANAIMIGGGAGVAYSTTTTGTGVLTALGVAVGSAGAFVTFNGALGTPSSGVATNLTGLPLTTGVTGVLGAANGGTGIANNAASTITISGSFASTFVVTGAFSYTFPTASATLFANNLGLSGGSTHIGGTAVGDALNLQGTSGNGTSTVAAIVGKVGNAGATTAFQVYNSGNFNIGNGSNTTPRILRVGQDTAFADFGSYTAATSYFALYACQATPGTSNYVIAATTAETNLNSTTTLFVNVNNSPKIKVTSAGVNIGSNATASAYCTLAAGTATAGTSPLKFVGGANLTAAEKGSMEFDGTNLFFSRLISVRETVMTNVDSTAPATNTIGVIIDYYGTSATRVLTTPVGWIGFQDGATLKKIPYYT